jgi:deoxyribodipyrimidine photo-lyase
MAATALVWIRRDLRVHDHPALHAALEAADRVVPVFVLDDRLVHGRFPSGPRTGFLLDSLAALRAALRQRGGELVIRRGAPERELPALARDTGAELCCFASDVSPFAMGRDRRVEAALREAGVAPRRTPGSFVADVGQPRTRDGRPFTVFSPFWRAWRELPRREVLPAPARVPVPDGLEPGEIPALAELGLEPELPEPLPAGEPAGRARMAAWVEGAELGHYHERQNSMDGGTSVLSPYLHFGCVSARELEARVAEREGKGPAAFRRQLGWRDFYAHVLLHFPENARHAFQRDMDALQWSDDGAQLAAWKAGKTGYPVVDAGMRQLATIGWMHNRARLITASFLTKDLHLDWRLGEAHFMRLLLCGDEAQNNGNWQWITSIGVDPAPYYRRLYNPVLQQRRHDPDGAYVRRWVPELRDVPLERLAEPWRMTDAEQAAAGCVIGRDYPAPVVDHAEERKRAIEAYQAVRGG